MIGNRVFVAAIRLWWRRFASPTARISRQVRQLRKRSTRQPGIARGRQVTKRGWAAKKRRELAAAELPREPRRKNRREESPAKPKRRSRIAPGNGIPQPSFAIEFPANES